MHKAFTSGHEGKLPDMPQETVNVLAPVGSTSPTLEQAHNATATRAISSFIFLSPK